MHFAHKKKATFAEKKEESERSEKCNQIELNDFFLTIKLASFDGIFCYSLLAQIILQFVSIKFSQIFSIFFSINTQNKSFCKTSSPIMSIIGLITLEEEKKVTSKLKSAQQLFARWRGRWWRWWRENLSCFKDINLQNYSQSLSQKYNLRLFSLRRSIIAVKVAN